MTCSEAAQLIYQFCEQKPSAVKEQALRAHLRICQKCKGFLSELGKRFQIGDLDVRCGEIPDELMEALSRILRSLDHT